MTAFNDFTQGAVGADQDMDLIDGKPTASPHKSCGSASAPASPAPEECDMFQDDDDDMMSDVLGDVLAGIRDDDNVSASQQDDVFQHAQVTTPAPRASPAGSPIDEDLIDDEADWQMDAVNQDEVIDEDDIGEFEDYEAQDGDDDKNIVYEDVFGEQNDRKRRHDDMEAFEPSDNFDATQPKSEDKQELNPFEEGLMRLKKRRRRDEVDPRVAEYRMSVLMQKMDDACTLDKEANKAGKPAVNKLRFLQTVRIELQKPAWAEWFVTGGGCHNIAAWFSPLPDGSEPSLTLKEGMLQIIKLLPISQENLKNSGLGKVVKRIYCNAKEPLANRRLCQDLINKWIRGVLGQSVSEAAHNIEVQKAYEGKVEVVKAKQKTKAEVAAEFAESNTRRHPQMFGKAENYFAVMPRTSVESKKEVLDAEKRSTKLTKKLRNMHGMANKARAKEQHVSIAGREINLTFA